MYGPLEVRGAPAGQRVLLVQYLVRLVTKRLKHGLIGFRFSSEAEYLVPRIPRICRPPRSLSCERCSLFGLAALAALFLWVPKIQHEH